MVQEWLSTTDVADRYGVPAETVRYWRHRGYGPVGVRLGNHVRYRAADWDAFVEQLAADELRKREAG